MPSFKVYESRTYDFVQVVEASSEEEAIQIAQELGEWDDDPGASTVFGYCAFEEVSHGNNV